MQELEGGDVQNTISSNNPLTVKILSIMFTVIMTMGGYFKYVTDKRVEEVAKAGDDKVRIIELDKEMYKNRVDILQNKYDSLQNVIRNILEGQTDWYLRHLKVELSGDDSPKEIKIKRK